MMDTRKSPLMFDYCENSRALGLSDLCKSLRTGRDFRANCQQQHHVLEILTSFSKSCEKGSISLDHKIHPYRADAEQSHARHFG